MPDVLARPEQPAFPISFTIVTRRPLQNLVLGSTSKTFPALIRRMEARHA